MFRNPFFNFFKAIIERVLFRFFQSPDGKYLACGSIDGFVNIFDIQASKLLHSFEGHAMPIRSIAFAPNSQVLCTASDDNYIKVFDV